MAKVSARGAHKLGDLTTSWVTSPDDQARDVFTLCSDGRILRKTQWRYREGERVHSTGLKLWARISKPENLNLAWLRARLDRLGYNIAD